MPAKSRARPSARKTTNNLKHIAKPKVATMFCAKKGVWETANYDGTPSAHYELNNVEDNRDGATFTVTFAGADGIVDILWPRHLLRVHRPADVKKPVVGQDYEVRENVDTRSIGWFRATCTQASSNTATFRWSPEYTGYDDEVMTLKQVARRVREC